MLFVSISAFTLLSLAACQSDSSSDPSYPPPTHMGGMAVLDAPLVGATVTIQDTEGKALYSETDATSENGSFIIDHPEARDFDIVVTGGTVGVGGPANTELVRTEVRDHDPRTYGFYLVDPISTLVSTYRGAHPQRTHADAIDAVWGFLQLPSTADHINDALFVERYFHRGAFMEAARTAGGLEPFLTELSRQIDAWPQEAPCFSEQCNPELLTGAAGFIAGAIAKGALSEIGGQAAGYLIQETLGWGKEPPNRQDEIISMLEEQYKLLGDLKVEIEHLEQSLKGVENRILATLNATEYNLIANSLNEIRSFIDTNYERLWLLSSYTYSGPDEAKRQRDAQKRVALAEELRRSLSSRNIRQDLNMIHKTLLASAPGERGLMDIWGNIHFDLGFTQDVYPQLADQLTYWYDVQVKLAYLLAEYYHAEGRDVLLEDDLKQVDKNLEEQMNAFLKRVETLQYVEEHYYKRPDFPYTRLQSFCWKGGFSASQLDKADALLGELMGRSKGFTVRLYVNAFNYGTHGARLDYTQLRIRNNDTYEIYTASPAVHTFAIWDPIIPSPRNPDVWKYAQIGRYTFEDLPYGTYQLVNDNDLYTKYKAPQKLSVMNELLYEVVDYPFSYTSAKPFFHVTALAWDQYYLASPVGCH